MDKNSPKEKKFLKIFWIAFSAPFALLFIIFILIITGALGFMPTFEDLENPQSSLASEIISEDGALLGKYYYLNRSYVDFDQLSPHVVNALVATEDIRFYDHSGIDARSLFRVFFKTVLLGSSSSGGGSTITQQLAKNLFPRDTLSNQPFLLRKSKLVITKFKEWITAIRLERNYTKNEILVMYLNTVPFGANAYGIKSASKTFFGVEPDSLKIEEAATLIGLLKAPTRYSPLLNPERSIQRRNVVLNQMRRYDFISRQAFDSISQLPMNLNYMAQDHSEGLATYFRETLRMMMNSKKPELSNYFSKEQYRSDSAEWVNNPLFGWCNKNKKPDGSNYNLYKDGIKIYTTINYNLQKYAEESMTQHVIGDLQVAFNKEKQGKKFSPFARDLTDKMVEDLLISAMKRTDRYRALRSANVSMENILREFKTPVRMRVFSLKGELDTLMSPWDSIRYYKLFLRSGLMSMDPNTGYVKAYVGGLNYKHFQYDQVKTGKRQVGSTIKPFLYTIAMQEGYSPCRQVPNLPVTFYVGDTTWTPKNSGRSEYEGQMVTLKWGLANSVNFISAWIMKEFYNESTKAGPQMMIDLMRKLGISSHLDAVPSIILGTPDISLFEMVGAYSTYANKGVYTTPIFVSRIEDKTGNVISTFTPQRVDAISDQTAYLMINLMEGVINQGTGARLRYKYGFTNAIAGKTGTTQNHSDGWFIGITPELVTGIWVGGEDRAIHFDNITMGQGANMALPVWGLYMQKAYADPRVGLTKKDFERPSGFNYDINCQSGSSNINYDDYIEEF